MCQLTSVMSLLFQSMCCVLSQERTHTLQSLNLGLDWDDLFKRRDMQLEAGPGQSLNEQLHGLAEGQLVVHHAYIVIIEKRWVPLVSHYCKRQGSEWDNNEPCPRWRSEGWDVTSIIGTHHAWCFGLWRIRTFELPSKVLLGAFEKKMYTCLIFILHYSIYIYFFFFTYLLSTLKRLC